MEYNTIKHHTKPGFTLIELLLSIGLFLIVFTTLTQGFVLINKIVTRLDVEREMTIFSSKILTQLGNDMDQMLLDPLASTEGSASLQDPTNGEAVRYLFTPLTTEEKAQLRSYTEIPQDELFVLQKEKGGTVERFFHPSFVLRNASLKMLPTEQGSWCTYPPLIQIHAELIYIPKGKIETPLTALLHTSFSTPEDPSSYLHRVCS